MKRYLLFFVFIIFTTVGWSQTKEKTNFLAGLWQYCVLKQGEKGFQLVPLHIYKFIQPNGDVVVLNNLRENSVGYISTRAVSRIESDSVYIEHVIFNATDKSFEGKDIHIWYRYQANNKLLFVKYVFPEKNTQGEEIWRRIQEEEHRDINN